MTKLTMELQRLVKTVAEALMSSHICFKLKNLEK